MTNNYQTNWIPNRSGKGRSELQVMTKSGRLVGYVPHARNVAALIAAFEGR